ncbi:pyridoxal phosphate-dependent aminotransferase [Nemorincola caseinilytica]|uniref:Pyridoxal phosphate-dependent aminotransferase n=1 Tax=Nemorincola caseinilytica TaxID=2054315 RepID=A0ABP8N8L4_9BACT
MSTLSRLAGSLVGSEVVKLGNEINRRIQAGEKIYNYTIGDLAPAVFPLPKELEDLIVQCYRDGYTNYPPAEGLAELRASVSAFIERYMGISYGQNEVLIASGGRPIIYTLFKAIVDAGDKVLYSVPSWNNNHYVSMNQGEHCMIDTYPENDFMPSVADIEPYIKEATLLCLCTPQNPTGTTMPRETMEGVCDMVLAENASRSGDAKKLYVMFDQMYGLLTYNGMEHHTPVSLRPAMKEYTIFVDGISKTFAATGVRVGWALGPAEILGKMKALLSHIGAWAPMAEQKATAKYLTMTSEVDAYLAGFRAGLQQRLTMFYEGFTALKNKGYAVDRIAPQAAIYLTVKVDLRGRSVAGRTLKTQEDVTQYILDKAQLAMVPFYCFGADSSSPWYRISVGTCNPEDIATVLALLEKALEGVDPITNG